MRLFVAVELSEEIKEFINELGEKLTVFSSVKSVKRDVCHLTLLFIGESEKIDFIINSLNRINFHSFELNTSDVGFFPNEKNPRVS